MLKITLLALLASCVSTPPPEEDLESLPPRSCMEWRLDESVHTTDLAQEVRVDSAPFFTPAGPSWRGADDTSTWTQAPREWRDHLGAYGQLTFTGGCVWRDAVEIRETATGAR